MKKGMKISWMALINRKITKLTGTIVDDPVGGVFKAVGVDCNGKSYSDLLHVSDKSIDLIDAHSCYDNTRPAGK